MLPFSTDGNISSVENGNISTDHVISKYFDIIRIKIVESDEELATKTNAWQQDFNTEYTGYTFIPSQLFT